MATVTGCLWLRKSLWSHFLVDESGSMWEASDGNLGVDVPVIVDLRTPTLLRAMTSSSVYSSKSPGVPGNSVSVFVNGPTVTNAASSPDRGCGIVLRVHEE